MNAPPLGVVYPRWSAPAHVNACTTERRGGVSGPPFASLNLGEGVGDRAADVTANRRLLCQSLALPGEPRWLEQRHGSRILDDARDRSDRRADRMVTGTPGVVCAVTTADCLPILLCDRGGTRIGAVHAGWRGLAAGVIQSGLAAMGRPAPELLAWIGPGIGARAYEVGEEVRDRILEAFAGAREFLAPARTGRWQADLAGIAERLLRAHGVCDVETCGRCTFSEPEAFFSFRRDGPTGRMATLIWLRAP